MIENLTKEQENQIEVYTEKWLKYGMSCEPVDLEVCKPLICEAYKQANLKPPTKFYLVDGPISAIKKIKELGLSTTDESALSSMIYGYHDASWLSFYDYMYNVLGLKSVLPLLPLIELSKNCGWWSAFEDTVILQQRHCGLHKNDEGELHNEEGPAVLYPDGFCVWAIDGKRVNEQIVMRPETLTIKQINQEEDQDMKSIMINRFGWVRYLEESNATCIDINNNIIENSKEALYTSPMGNRLVVTCPTGRIFALGVPSAIKSCNEAQEWLGSHNGEKINVIART